MEGRGVDMNGSRDRVGVVSWALELGSIRWRAALVGQLRLDIFARRKARRVRHLCTLLSPFDKMIYGSLLNSQMAD